MAGLNLTFSQERASKIADVLGWCNDVTLEDVVGALINALQRIDALESRIARLRTPAEMAAEHEADIAASDLAAEHFGDWCRDDEESIDGEESST